MGKHHLLIGFIAACAAFSFVGGRAEGADVGSVSGRVTTTAGAPIAGATVELLGGAAARVAKTTKAGVFAFTGVIPGSYTVSTTAREYQKEVSAPFSVTPGNNVDFAVVLQPITTTNITTLGRISVNGHQALNTSSAASATITNDQFVDSGSLQAQTALDRLPGFTVEHYDNGAPGAVATFTIRGAGGFGGGTDGTANTGYEILVLQDGEPIRNGQYGDFEASSLTPAIYQRVEVVKGVGGTSLFGANTIGGTVNLVTRDPLKSEGGEFIQTLGGYGTSDTNISESATIGRLGYLLDLHRYGTDGFIPFPYVAHYVPFRGASDYAQPTQTFDLKSGLGKLRYDFSDSMYGVLTVTDESDYRDQLGLIGNTKTVGGQPYDQAGYPYFYGFPGDYVWNIQPKYALDLHATVGGGSLILRGYSQTLQRVVDGLGEPPDICCFLSRSVDHLTGQLASYTKDVGKNTLTLAVGGNGDNYFFGQSFNSVPFSQLPIMARGTQLERTALLRDDVQASSKIDLTFAGYYSNYDTLRVKRFDPRFAIVDKPNSNTVLRASIGTGFAPPRLSDLFTPLDLFARDAIFSNIGCPAGDAGAPYCVATSGNADLKAESAVGGDVGYEHTFGDGGNLSLDVYRTNLKNHIFNGLLPAPAGLTFDDGTPVAYISKSLNIARAVYTGVEFSAALPLSRYFALDGSYNIQAAYPTDVDTLTQTQLQDVVNNQQFLGVPLHKENASLVYGNHARTNAFVQWNFYAANNAFNQAPFSLYNAGVNTPLGDSTLHVAWSNIFNKQAGLFANFNGGVPYPGYSGPYSTTAYNTANHMLTVTFDHRWGALR
ncbi:MAG: TonB-dependent receptor [Candidatus Eremiobacteraeota bacterium]|nr:TonB-dependent receptor [Candidatus Eremiobacteraeota bacterium]MBC5826614.1 TonB-dependent receptor [Candidatus Eremiobacteraeota bacterium]